MEEKANTLDTKEERIIVKEYLPPPTKLKHPWYYYVAGISYIIIVIIVSGYIMYRYSGL